MSKQILPTQPVLRLLQTSHNELNQFPFHFLCLQSFLRLLIADLGLSFVALGCDWILSDQELEHHGSDRVHIDLAVVLPISNKTLFRSPVVGSSDSDSIGPGLD